MVICVFPVSFNHYVVRAVFYKVVDFFKLCKICGLWLSFISSMILLIIVL